MEKNFKLYDYKNKTVKQSEQTAETDFYGAFGWEPADISPAMPGSVTITFRRDRKAEHKAELVRLEKKAEGLRENGAKLKKERTRGASVFAWTFGSCSALLLGGGMSLTMLVTDSLPAMIGGIALGIAGIALCALNDLFYRRLAAKKTEKLLPLEEENGEKLAVVCEQAHELAANGELL